MLFKRLVEYFGRIESTSLRNEKMVILALILKEASGKEVEELINLALGQLRPQFERLEFNMAEKMILRAIGATGEEYRKVGDLGELAVKIKSQGSEGSELGITQVYGQLEKIARESGSGSQEKKVTGLARLTREMDGQSAKYIVRMVAGKLRLGFSDKTVIDALSYLEKGTKEYSEILEQAYQRRPDVGVLARVVKEQGAERAVATIDVEIGTPIVPALAQRLKTPAEMIEKMGRVYCEPKYDGTRCVGGLTGVFEKSRGYITVKGVCVGDKVLTHKGNFCEVVDKTSRSRKRGERVFELQSYLGDKLRISEGHPVLVESNGDLVWKKIEDLSNEWLFYPRPKLKEYPPVQAEKLFVDKAGYSKSVLLNERVMQFLGFWVGDGFSNTSHQMERVGIVCNAAHTKLIKDYEDIIMKELHITEVGHDKRRGAEVLYWRDPVMRRWLCDNFRGASESGKKIPEWFFGLDKKRWEAFLLGWKQADGSDKHGGGYLITTKERQVAMMGQIMSIKHGIVSGVRKMRNHAQNGITRTYYQLIFPGTNQCWREYKDGFLIKILHKNELKKNLNHRVKLYDIQVDTDESFCVSVGCLHNCQIHFSRNGCKGSELGARKFGNVEVEPKLGGQARMFEVEKPKFSVRTFTRNLDESSAMFPELQRIGEQIKAQEVILDSEAVGYDPKTGKLVPFQLTITRKRKHGVSEAQSSVPLRFFVFDIMYLDGVSLIRLPLRARRKILSEVVQDRKGSELGARKFGTMGAGSEVLDRKGSELGARKFGTMGPLVVDEYIETESADVLRKYHKRQLAAGLEGAVIKQVEGEYMPGRTGFNWVKFKESEDSRAKLSDTVDAVIMGYYKGKGKRQKFGVGAFLIGIRGNNEEKILTLAKVGTGITDEMFIELGERFKSSDHSPKITQGSELLGQKPDQYVVPKTLEPDVWVEPKIIVEVAADEITKSPTHSAGYALRFPRLVKFRDDKGLEQITTLGEIETMFGIVET